MSNERKRESAPRGFASVAIGAVLAVVTAAGFLVLHDTKMPQPKVDSSPAEDEDRIGCRSGIGTGAITGPISKDSAPTFGLTAVVAGALGAGWLLAGSRLRAKWAFDLR